MIFLSLEYRENFRKTILNWVGNKEVWKFHPNYINIMVSSEGKVKNYLTGTELSLRKTKQGYMTCTIPMYHTIGFKKNKSELVHRLVAETFFDYLDNEIYEVNHVNGDKQNNSVFNINWLTRKENLQHARDSGLFKKQFGENNGMFKYTNEDIKTIKLMKEEGYSIKDLSFLLNIKETSVYNLIKRRLNE